MRLNQHIIVGVFASALGLACGLAGAQIPVPKLGSPNALVQGDVRGSIEVFRQLHSDLKSRNWNVDRFPFLKYRLPDQDFAQDPALRDRNTVAIIGPDFGADNYHEVAFYTDIYVRENFKRLSDWQAETNPEGFYLVCYKDGRIEQVPVDQARMLPIRVSGGTTTYVPVFPGMAAYRSDMDRLPFYKSARNTPRPLP